MVVAVVVVLLVGATAAYAAGLRFTARGLGTASDDNVTIPKFASVISATALPATATVGTSVGDRAQLSGVTSGAGGTITYKLFGPGDAQCVTAAGPTATVPVAGPNPYDSGSLSTNGLLPGVYRWVATYTGDARNTTTATGCADSSQVLTLIASGFSATTLRLLNGAAPAVQGEPDATDRIEVDFGAAVSADSICSGWTGATGLVINARLTDQSVNSTSNDQFKFTAATGCSGGLNVGVLDLGGPAFYNGGGNTKYADYAATLSLTNGGSTLVITLGAGLSKEVNQVLASVTATFTPSASLKSGAATISATPVTKTGIAF